MKLDREKVTTALKICTSTNNSETCNSCPYFPSGATCIAVMCADALSLIRELTEENERLTINMNAYGITAKNLAEEKESVVADTVRKIVKKFKQPFDETEELCRDDPSEMLVPASLVLALLDKVAKDVLEETQ